jgi:hypothetical protein
MIILKGAFQLPKNTHSGRIYPQHLFDKAYERYVRRIIRLRKIKLITNGI